MAMRDDWIGAKLLTIGIANRRSLPLHKPQAVPRNRHSFEAALCGKGSVSELPIEPVTLEGSKMSDLLELQKLFDRWTERFIARDIDACTALFASNGAIYQPNAGVIEGPDAIRFAHRVWMDAGEINKKVTVVDGRISENMAYCVARYSGDYPSDDGSMTTETGTVVSVLLCDPDGNWRWRLSALHSD